MTKAIIVGAGVSLIVISFYVFGVDHPKPEWGQFWKLKPLIITPLTGAIGGIIFHVIRFKFSRKLGRAPAIALGLVLFVILLWTGVVLGLDGTMWD